jgi:hypothetical protein
MTSIITTSIVWDVEQMDCYPTYESETDVVFTVHWRCTATKDQYIASSYGTVGCTYEAGAPFTPYAQLTEQQVLGWVWETVNKDATEAALAQNIADQINPPVVSPPLPWVS